MIAQPLTTRAGSIDDVVGSCLMCSFGLFFDHYVVFYYDEKIKELKIFFVYLYP